VVLAHLGIHAKSFTLELELGCVLGVDKPDGVIRLVGYVFRSVVVGGGFVHPLHPLILDIDHGLDISKEVLVARESLLLDVREELLNLGEVGREVQASIDVLIGEEVAALLEALVNGRLRVSFVGEGVWGRYCWRSGVILLSVVTS
jgi:hypothetical protein